MKTSPKTTYRIRNWKEYDAALKQRGSITFWVNEAVIEQWKNTATSLGRGVTFIDSCNKASLNPTYKSQCY